MLSYPTLGPLSTRGHFPTFCLECLPVAFPVGQAYRGIHPSGLVHLYLNVSFLLESSFGGSGSVTLGYDFFFQHFKDAAGWPAQLLMPNGFSVSGSCGSLVCHTSLFRSRFQVSLSFDTVTTMCPNWDLLDFHLLGAPVYVYLSLYLKTVSLLFLQLVSAPVTLSSF